MSHDTALTRLNESELTRDRAPGADNDAAVVAAGLHPLAKLHGLLRGRYLLTIILAIVMGGGAACAAYMLWKPRYQSVAQIRVAPNVPRILFRSEQNDVMPMYESYVGSQMAMMTSERVIDRAMRKPQWRQFDQGLSDQAAMEFRQNVSVQRDQGSEMILIRYTDANPDVAQTGTKAMVEAYMEIFGEEDIKRHKMQLGALENRRASLGAESKSLREQILSVADPYGTDSLDEVFTTQLTETQQLAATLKGLEVDVAEQMLVVKNTPSYEQLPPPPPQVIAQSDRTMETLIAEKEAIELQVIELLYFRTEEHPMVKRARSRLSNVMTRIKTYQDEFNRLVPAPEPKDLLEGEINKYELLRVRNTNYETFYNDAKERMLEIGRRNLQLTKIRYDLTDTEKRLEVTEARIEQLNVESTASSRITVISPGDRPGAPVNAGQRVQMSGLAGLGGVSGALAIMMLVGAGNRRIRFMDQAKMVPSRTMVLGAIPEVTAQTVDDESARLAAMSVHQIRSRLQLEGLGKTRHILAVTSAGAGEGKTSVACALALSLAASGTRTLLIDFDLYGQGLTSVSMDRPLLGDLLVREGALLPHQLKRALSKSVKQGTRIGDVLVEAGYVTRETVEAVARKQWILNCGLADVLGGEPIDRCVVRHLPDPLSILPVGNTDGHDLTTMSPAKIGKFLEGLKQDYDVVLLDCGPVPASLEASIVIPHSDGVLFVVSQGTRESAVQRAYSHLDDLRANMAGVVFNRGLRQDLKCYGSSSSSSQGRARMNNIVNPDEATAGFAETFGPLAHATAKHQRRRERELPLVVWDEPELV